MDREMKELFRSWKSLRGYKVSLAEKKEEISISTFMLPFMSTEPYFNGHSIKEQTCMYFFIKLENTTSYWLVVSFSFWH